MGSSTGYFSIDTNDEGDIICICSRYYAYISNDYGASWSLLKYFESSNTHHSVKVNSKGDIIYVNGDYLYKKTASDTTLIKCDASQNSGDSLPDNNPLSYLISPLVINK